MIMRICIAAIFSLWIFAVVGCGKQATSDATPRSNTVAEKAAVESAQAWLELVDGGNFAKSWEDASGCFKSAVSQTDWDKAVQTARTPLGKAVSRKIKSRQYGTSLPGAPDGEYVVLQYDTAFENKAKAVETITPMLNKDGKWRVSGYYIK
jgi:hypothetical protein